jgi:GNAT superfamily N-acetyltransferase
MYRVREVDAFDEDTIELLTDLHTKTFLNSAPLPKFEVGHWWVACRRKTAVAFAGVVPATAIPDCGYFCRVGVVREHCGNGLQLRLMRAVESRARRNGWRGIVSDTTDNLVSANNFIRAGYCLFEPPSPWGWAHTLYWRKRLSPML